MSLPLFSLGFITSTAFWSELFSPSTALRWAFLAVAIPMLLLTIRPHEYLPSGKWIAVFLGVIGLTLTPSLSQYSLTGVDEFIHLMILASALYLGTYLKDLKPIWVGIAVGVNVSAVIALIQFFGWEGLPQAVPPSGLFMNRNVLSESGAVALIAAMFYSAWWLVPGALIAVLLGGSKAVLGALALVGLVYLGVRIRTAIALGVIAIAVLFAIDHPSLTIRADIWWPALSSLSFFGHGLGSFVVDFPTSDFAHNEYLQLMYELGVLSIAFFALFIQALRGHRGVEYYILATILAVGVFAFPLHLPLTGFAAALAIGHLLSGGTAVWLPQPKGRMAYG